MFQNKLWIELSAARCKFVNVQKRRHGRRPFLVDLMGDPKSWNLAEHKTRLSAEMSRINELKSSHKDDTHSASNNKNRKTRYYYLAISQDVITIFIYRIPRVGWGSEYVYVYIWNVYFELEFSITNWISCVSKTVSSTTLIMSSSFASLHFTLDFVVFEISVVASL